MRITPAKSPLSNLRVLSLTANNFMLLKAVHIEFEANGSTVIVGKNGAGKTSIHHAIEAAILGASAFPDMPIRIGTETAYLQVVLGTGTEIKLTVERTITAKGQYLKITDPSGTLKSGQAILDAILHGNKTFFNPLDFCGQPAKVQRERLLAALPDLAAGLAEVAKQDKELEEAAKIARADDTRTAGALTKFGSAPAPGLAKQEEASASAILAKQDARNKDFTAVRDLQGEHDDLTRDISSVEINIQEAEGKLERWKKELADKRKAQAGFGEQIKAASAKAQAHPTQDAFKDVLANVESTNAKIRDAKKYKALADEQREAKAKLTEIKSKREKLVLAKEKLLKESKLPVDGLEFTDDGLLLDGVPLSQVNTAKQIEFGVRLAIAVQPDFRTLLVDEGSVLDADNRAVLHKLAKDNDMSIVMLCIDGENAIRIEDGEIIDEPKPKPETAEAGEIIEEAANAN